LSVANVFEDADDLLVILDPVKESITSSSTELNDRKLLLVQLHLTY